MIFWDPKLLEHSCLYYIMSHSSPNPSSNPPKLNTLLVIHFRFGIMLFIFHNFLPNQVQFLFKTKFTLLVTHFRSTFISVMNWWKYFSWDFSYILYIINILTGRSLKQSIGPNNSIFCCWCKTRWSAQNYIQNQTT